MSEWISVKDKLPAYDKEVFVYRKLCNKPGCVVYHGINITTAKYLEKALDLVKYYHSIKNNSFDCALNDRWSQDNIIAWMPIPELPQDIKDKQ